MENKARKNSLTTHKHYGSVVKWTKLLSITGGTQIIVQLCGLVSGFLLVKFMPVTEYAYYTVVNSMLGTMTILADGGIATGVIAYGGKVWQDKYKLGEVLATGISLRKIFAFFSLLVNVPILYYMLHNQGAQWWQILLMVGALIPAFYAAVSDSVLEIVPKLHQDIKPLQKNQLVVTIGRFVLSVVGVFLVPFTATALLATGLPRMYGNYKLRKITEKFIDTSAAPNAEVKKSILSIVKKRLPEAIYYSFTGQITIWLLTIFGNVTSVAQIGALSKMSLITTSFTIVAGMLIIPRFARLPNERGTILKKYIQGFVFSLVCLLFILFLLSFVSQYILMFFGKDYEGLDNELLLYFVGAIIGFMANFTYSLFSSRGWLMNPVFSISVNALSLAVCAYLIKVTSLEGAIFFGIANASIQFVVNTSFLIYTIYKKTE